VTSTNCLRDNDSEFQQYLAEKIAGIAKMDESALAEFYERTSRWVYGVVQRILKNHAIAEEITLDVYLQIWRQAGQYNAGRGGPWTWLLMIARSRAIDALRSRRKEAQEERFDSVDGIDHHSPCGEWIMSENGRRKIIRSALDSLVPAQREAIELTFFWGLSHNEIAEKLQQPLGTVKSRIRLGMLRLRDRLQP